MENKFKHYYTKTVQQLKQFFSHVFWVALVVVGLGIGFGVGYYYKQIKTVEMPSKMKVVKKQDVFIAVDEYQRFMIIEKTTGNYTVFQDSVGQTIFNMYARNIWGQHNSTPSTPAAK